MVYPDRRRFFLIAVDDDVVGRYVAMCIPFGKYRVGQGVEGSAETLIVTIVVEKNIRQGLALNPLGKGDIYIYGVTRYRGDKEGLLNVRCAV